MADEKQNYQQQICQFIPINELPQHVQQEVVNNVTLLRIRKGGHVFKQGDRDEFSYYLVEGEIELHANKQLHNTIVGGTDRARYAMAQLQPRQFSARASKPSVIMQVRRDYLDKLMVLHEKEGDEITEYDLAKAEMEVSDLHAEDDVDWMTRMLQSELFSRMPTANIQSLFALLEPVEFKKGDVVIKQGDAGQEYYIIQEGRCEVLRAPTSGGKEIKLAILNPGDSFGEEALISNTTRNATIAMITDGVLMRLSKDKFEELVKKPTLQSVKLERAQKLIAEGALWLDVRFKNEHEQGAMPNSINIPLNMLRMQADKLDRNKRYVVYCDTSGRSSTAAFLLAGRGYNVCFLEGGLVNNPEAGVVSAAEPAKSAPAEAPKAAAPAPKAAPRPPAPPPAPKRAEAPPPAPAQEDDDEELDPDVKASVLEAELARTDLRLKDMEKMKEQVRSESMQAAQAEVERRLQEERGKIELAKKEAEKESARLRKVEEEKLQKMKHDAEQRLQAEKKKLEEVYSRNTEEMEKLQRLRQEAEEQMKRDREKLEKEAETARMQLEEAQKLKKQVEAAKRAIEKEADKHRKETEEMERKIQEKAREKLQEERRKLAEQFARNNDELEKAKRERAEADAARQAAREEAARIIEEYKTKHAEARAQEEARMKEERRKLEAQQQEILKSLQESERARQEAEKAREATSLEIEKLRSKQRDAETTQSKVAQRSIEDEIQVAEEKLSRAKREIDQAREAQEKAEAAKRVNEKDLQHRIELDEELRRQLENDLSGFKKEMEEEEKKFSSMSAQLEHMRRIKQSANAAKQAAREANDSLLNDVASQLGRPQS